MGDVWTDPIWLGTPTNDVPAIDRMIHPLFRTVSEVDGPIRKTKQNHLTSVLCHLDWRILGSLVDNHDPLPPGEREALNLYYEVIDSSYYMVLLPYGKSIYGGMYFFYIRWSLPYILFPYTARLLCGAHVTTRGFLFRLCSPQVVRTLIWLFRHQLDYLKTGLGATSPQCRPAVWADRV